MTGSFVDLPELLTISEGAAALRISRSKLYQLAADSIIPTVRVDGCDKVLFRKKDLQEALKSQSRKTAAHVDRARGHECK